MARAQSSNGCLSCNGFLSSNGGSMARLYYLLSAVWRRRWGWAEGPGGAGGLKNQENNKSGGTGGEVWKGGAASAF